MSSSSESSAAPSPQQWVHQLARSITPTDEDRRRALEWRLKLIKVLLPLLEVNTGHTLSGSTDRRTDVKPKSDTDMLIRLPKKYENDDGKTVFEFCFDKVDKAVALSGLPLSFRKQACSVGLTEKNPKSNSIPVSFDLVFVINREDAAGFKIVTQQGQWVNTYPKSVNAALVAAANKARPVFNLNQTIRLLKHWNYQHQHKLKSLHIEVLMYGFTVAKGVTGLDHRLLAALRFVRDNIDKPVSVPGSESDPPLRVDEKERNAIVTLLNRQIESLDKAYSQQGQAAGVGQIAQWKTAFGY